MEKVTHITKHTFITFIFLLILGCKDSKQKTYYAENDKQIKKEFLTKVLKDYKSDTICIYTTWLGMCGNDEQLNKIEKNTEPTHISNFIPKDTVFSIDNKKLIVCSVEQGKENKLLKEFPKIFKLDYILKGNKITYRVGNNQYDFKIKWVEKTDF